LEPTENGFKPYASPENIVRTLARVRRGGVRKVDAEFLVQIGIGEGMTARTLRALEYLGLIAEDGSLTPLFEEYVVASDEDAAAVLQGAVRRAYDPIFRAVDPSTDDRSKVHTAFRTMQPSGQWARMVTLFLGLCQAAGIAVKEPPSNRPGKEGPPRDKPRGTGARKPPPVTRVQPNQGMQDLFSGNIGGVRGRLDPALAGIVAKIPEIDTREDLERWWTMFRSAFEFIKKI
jgi:hypothetical protein